MDSKDKANERGNSNNNFCKWESRWIANVSWADNGWSMKIRLLVLQGFRISKMEVPGPPESGRAGGAGRGGAAESLPKMQLGQTPLPNLWGQGASSNNLKKIRGLLLGELDQRTLDSGSPGTDVVRGKNRNIYWMMRPLRFLLPLSPWEAVSHPPPPGTQKQDLLSEAQLTKRKDTLTLIFLNKTASQLTKVCSQKLFSGTLTVF